MAEDTQYVQGLDALLAEIRDLPGNIEKNAMRAATKEAAALLAGAISQEAPISTPIEAAQRGGRFKGIEPGYLKKSIHPKSIKPRRGEVAAGVKGAFYAKMVEKGHTLKSHGKKKDRVVIGHVAPNNFIQRAVEANKQWAVDLMQRMVVVEIKKRVDKLQRKMAKDAARG